MAFDIYPNGPILVDGDTGERLDCLVGAEGALFVPHVVMHQEVL